MFGRRDYLRFVITREDKQEVMDIDVLKICVIRHQRVEQNRIVVWFDTDGGHTYMVQVDEQRLSEIYKSVRARIV